MKIRDIEINYIQYGNENGKSIVLLHGWGQNIEMMNPLGKGLKDEFFITIIDLPGFGKSEEPDLNTTIYDYNEIVYELFQILNIEKPILIGHSFGGRISILYAEKYGVEKLILLGSPYKKSQASKSFKTKVLKTLKKLPLMNDLAEVMKKNIGSRDYKDATKVMRSVLVNTINEDLEQYLTKIKAPTLLIWGDLDSEVPLEHARAAERNMINAGLVIYQNRGHFAYLEELDRTILIIREFLKKEVE